MTRLRAIRMLMLWALALPGVLPAQQGQDLNWEVLSDQGWVEYDYQTHLATITNGGVLVRS